MRRTREEAAGSRQRIVAAAARIVRQHGIAGLGVAEVMKAAGMTHGGFYRHFASREALLAEALDAAFDDLPGLAGPDGGAGTIAAVRGHVDAYLSAGHVAHPEAGCPLAAVGGEIARAPHPVRETFGRRTRERIGTLASALGASSPAPRPEAIRLLATMVGAVVLARSLPEGPDRDEVLAAARAAVDERLAPPP